MRKSQTLQVFDELKGCYGAGEWTRTTDLLITNKLLGGKKEDFSNIWRLYWEACHSRALRNSRMNSHETTPPRSEVISGR